MMFALQIQSAAIIVQTNSNYESTDGNKKEWFILIHPEPTEVSKDLVIYASKQLSYTLQI